ncbi:GspE/PulE family protein [Kaarinaea lacus]
MDLARIISASMSSNAQNIIDLPKPPLSMKSDADALAGAEMEVQLLSGGIEKGTLLALQGPQQSVVIKTARDNRPRDISFSIIRSVKINAAIMSRQGRHPLTTRGGDVQLPEVPQPFQLHYNDNRVIEGETWSWQVDEYGLHLFPRDTLGNTFRMFVPLQVLQQYRIGPLLKKIALDPSEYHRDSSQIASNSIDLKLALQHLPPQIDKPLGEFLVDEQLISQEQLRNALVSQQREPERKLGELLEASGVVTTDEIYHALAMQLGLPFVRLRNFDIDPSVLTYLSEDIARKYSVMPLFREQGHVVVAVANPAHTEMVSVLRFTTASEIEVAVATKQDIDWAINNYYGNYNDNKAMEEMQQQTLQPQDGKGGEQADMTRLAMEKPTVRLVNHMVLDAIQRRASDIHLRPNEEDVDLLLRIHGSLVKLKTFDKLLLPAIVSRIKILGRMDISERRLPQDGRTKFVSQGNEVDLRISVMPTINGESVVIRLLNKQEGLRDIHELGFTAHDEEQITHMLHKSYGMLLVTGPTGSGKSTTLYAALQEVIKQNVNIITVEDPVEYHVPGIQQIQVNTAPNYTFARALRNILRHDPDVIMVGEIRDQETAKIAVECALTGHLVLSTLHTNSGAGTIARLIEMDIEPYLLKTTLLGVLAQRLVRTNCPHCLEEEPVEDAVRAVLNIGPEEKFYRGVGCETCNQTGYSGRAAVYELLMMTNNMRALVSEHVGVDEIQSTALEDGMIPLTQNALRLARERITSLREVYRVRLE